MTELAGFQRRWLRGRAHGLDPIIHVGKGGVTAALRSQFEAVLLAHELIKVRFVGGLEKAEKKALAAELCKESGASLAGLVGHIGIFYRAHPEKEERKLVLPTRAAEDESTEEA